MTGAAAGTETYRSDFARAERDVLPTLPAWIAALRRENWERFERLGFPEASDEDWRGTPVARIARAPFRAAGPAGPAKASALARNPLADLGATRLVFANGRFVPSLSSPANGGGIFAGPLGEALASRGAAVEERLGRIAPRADRAFAALNAALADDVAVVVFEAGARPEAPVHVVHLALPDGESGATYPRTLIVAAPGSRASVIETYLGDAPALHLTCAATEVDVAEDASVEHARVQAEAPAALHLGTVDARLGRGAGLVSHNVSLGSALARVELGAVLGGEGSDCSLNGLYLADASRHVDQRTTVEHAVPRSVSRQTYRGILGGEARAVFRGRIRVAPGAQRTDAFQSNHNLLLSDGALVSSRPQLEIYADDVRCTHGATVGQLDADALFYLRSRGIGAGEARRLLTEAFGGEIVRRIGFVPLRERLAAEASARSAAAAGDGGAR